MSGRDFKYFSLTRRRRTPQEKKSSPEEFSLWCNTLAKTFSIAIPVQDLCQQNSRVDGFSKIQSEGNGLNGSNYLGIRGIPKNRK